MILDSKEKKMRMLIVDDFANMRRTIKNMLRQIGFEKMEEADDGDTAVDKLEYTKIDFIICDWNMPRMPGIDVLRAVRGNPKWKHIPFLLVTAENWEDDIAEAAEERVDGYIIKPFVTKTLEDKLKDILEKRKNPSPGEKLFREAFDDYDEGRLPEAADKLKQVLQIKVDSAKATHLLGLVSLANGDLDNAEKLFKLAIEYNKNYAKSYHDLAETYIKKEDIPSAITNLEQAIKISPRIADRRLLLAQLLINEKRYQDSLEHLKIGVKRAFNQDEVKEKVIEMIKDIPKEEKDNFFKDLDLTLSSNGTKMV